MLTIFCFILFIFCIGSSRREGELQHFIKNEPMNTKEICVSKGIFLLVFFIALNFLRLWFVGVRLLTNKRSVKISKD